LVQGSRFKVLGLKKSKSNSKAKLRFKVQGLRTSKFHQPACSQQAGTVPSEAGRQINPLQTQKQMQKQNCLLLIGLLKRAANLSLDIRGFTAVAGEKIIAGSW
jgi:hypothetical protein